MADKVLNYKIGISADASLLMSQINQAIDALEKLAVSSNITPSLQSASKAALELSNNLRNATNVNTGQLDLLQFSNNLKRSNKSLTEYANELKSVGLSGEEAFYKVARAITTAELPIKRSTKLLDSLWITMKNTMRWLLTSSALNTFVGSLETAYGYAKDLDESLNRIRIVTKSNAEEMAEFAKLANKAAQELNTTTTNYTKASLIYYQLGLSDLEVLNRTNATIKYANVADLDTKEASEQLTAVWNNFYDGSKTLEYYIDVMAKLGATTASSSSEISEGLQKFAAVADTVGLSYEYAASALATITATTRESADVVGTALKTLLGRLESLKLGETLDDGTTLAKYSSALNSIGVKIKELNGELRLADDILEDLAAKWGTIDRATLMAVALTVGGVRQYTHLIALMDNWDFMKQNLVTAAGAEGELDEQARVYAESWLAARDNVTAATQEIYSSLINPQLFISLDRSLVPVLNRISEIIDSMGGLGGVINNVLLLISTLYGDKIAAGMLTFAENIALSTNLYKERIRTLQSEAAELAKDSRYAYDNTNHLVALKVLMSEGLSLRLTINEQMDNLNESLRLSLEYDMQSINSLEKELNLWIEKGKEADRLARLNKESLLNTPLASEASTQLNEYWNNLIYLSGSKISDTGLANLIGTPVDDDAYKNVLALSNVLDEIINKRTALQSVVTVLLTTGDGLTITEDKVREIATTVGITDTAVVDAIAHAAKAGDLDAVIDEVRTHIRGAEVDIRIVQGALESLGLSHATVDRLVTSLRDLKFTESEIARILEVVTEAMQKLKKALDDGAYSGQNWANVIVSLGQSLMSLNMAINSLNSLFDVFNNKDLTSIERFTKVITALSMLAPVLGRNISLLSKLGETFKRVAKGTVGLSAAVGALLPALTLLGVAIIAIVKVYDELTISLQEATEAIEEAASKYEDVANELQNLSSELETAKNKLQELQDLAKEEPLSFVELEEVTNLKTLIALLEARKKIAEDTADIERRNLVSTILSNYKTSNKDVLNPPSGTIVADTVSWWLQALWGISHISSTGFLPSTDTPPLSKTFTTSGNYAQDMEELAKLLNSGELTSDEGQSLLTLVEEYWLTRKDLLDLLEESYSVYIDALLRGLVLPDEDFEAALVTARESIYSFGQWLDLVLATFNADNMPTAGEIYGALLNGSINEYEGLVEDTLKAFGITFDKFVEVLLFNIDSTKEKLSSFLSGDEVNRFLTTLSNEDLDILLKMEVLEGDSFKTFWKRFIELKRDNRITFEVELDYAKTTTKDALNKIISGEDLESSDFEALKDALSDLYPQIEDIERMSKWDLANTLSAALVSTATEEGIKSRIQSRRQLIEDEINLWKDKKKEAYKEILGTKEQLSDPKTLMTDLQTAQLEVVDTTNQLLMQMAELKWNGFNEPSLIQIVVDTLKELLAGNVTLDEVLSTNTEDLKATAEDTKSILEDIGDTAQDTTNKISKVTSKDKVAEAATNIEIADGMIESLEEDLDRLNDYQFDKKKIEIEVDEAFIMTLMSKLSVLKQATDLIDKNYRITAENAEKLVNIMPELFNLLDANNIEFNKGMLQLNKEVVDSYIEGIQTLTNAQGLSLEQLLTLRAVEALQELNLVDGLTKDINANKDVEKEYDLDLKRALVMQAVKAQILKKSADESTTKSAIDNQNLITDASQENAKKFSENWREGMNAVISYSADMAKRAIDNLNYMVSGGTTGSINRTQISSLLGSVGTNKGNSVWVDNSSDITATVNSKYQNVMDYLEGKLNDNGVYGEPEYMSLVENAAKVLLEELGWDVGSNIYNSSEVFDSMFSLLVNDPELIAMARSFDSKELAEALKNLTQFKDFVYDILNPGKSSSSKTKSKDEKNLDKELDRYHEINREIERQKKLLSEIEKQTSRAYGISKLLKYDELIEATTKLQEDYELKLREAQDRYYNYDRNKLTELFGNVTFGLDGEIANYEALLTKMVEDYNAAVATGDDTAISNAKEIYELRKLALEQYEKTLDVIAEMNLLIEEQKRTIADEKLGKITYKLEVALDIRGMKKDLNNLSKEIAESFGDAITHGLLSAIISADEALLTAGMYDTFALQLAELDTMLNDPDVDLDKLVDAYQNLFDNCISSAEELLDWVESIEEILPNAIDAAADRFSLFTDQLEHNTSVLETIKELYALLGVTYKTMEGYNRLLSVTQETYDAQLATAELLKAWFDGARQELFEAEAALAGVAETDAAYDTLKANRDALLEEYNKALEAYLEAAQAAMEAAKEMYTNALEKASYDFSKAITNGVGLDLLQDKYDNYIDTEERYLDTVNELYLTNIWDMKISAAIDEATTNNQKERLKALRDELDIRRLNGTLSLYDLDILEAKYNVILATNALEDALNSKSKMKLVRDKQGNWNYLFVADDTAVLQAQEDLLNVLNEYYNIAKTQVKDVTGEIISAWQECNDKIKEIYEDETMTVDEREAAIAEIREYYATKVKDLETEKNIAITDMNLAALESIMYMSQEGVGSIIDMSGNSVPVVLKMSDEILSIISTMEENTGITMSDMAKLYVAVLQLMGVDTSEITSGISLDALGNIASMSENIKERLQDMVDGSALLGDLWSNDFALTLDEMTDNASKFDDMVDKYIDDMNNNWDTYANKVSEVANRVDLSLEDLEYITDRVSYSTDRCRDAGLLCALAMWQQVSAAQSASLAYAALAQSIYLVISAMLQLAAQSALRVLTIASTPSVSSSSVSFDPNVDYSALMGEIYAREGNSEAYLLAAALREAKIAAGYSGYGVTTSLIDLFLLGGGTLSALNREYYPELTDEEWRRFILGYATGGYTGSFDDAKLALLHEKELVLNQDDTANILSAVTAIRSINPDLIKEIERTLDNNALASMYSIASKLGDLYSAPSTPSVVEQDVKIEAHFPNVTSSNEIQDALTGLIDKAAQWTHRRTE